MIKDYKLNDLADKCHNNIARSLLEEIYELRKLLTKAYEQLLLLGYDSGFTNEAIDELINDITKYLMETKQ